MPRFLLSTVTAVALLALVAPAAPLPKDAAKPKLYFPTTVGAKWVYERDGTEVTHVVTKVESKDDSKLVSVGIVQGEHVVHFRTIRVSPEGIWQVAHLGWRFTPELVWFKLPIQVGKPQQEGTFGVIGSEKVKVPAGTFEAVKVVEEFGPKDAPFRISYWFSTDVGIIKTTYAEPTASKEAVTVLKSFTPGKD